MDSRDEQKILKEWVNHPGTKLMAEKLRTVARQSLKRQLDCDPYREPDEIKRQQQLRYVLASLIPRIVTETVNYDPLALDKQVPPRQRWSIAAWFSRFIPEKGRK